MFQEVLLENLFSKIMQHSSFIQRKLQHQRWLSSNYDKELNKCFSLFLLSSVLGGIYFTLIGFKPDFIALFPEYFKVIFRV